jgi:hypothetical protein
LVFGGAELRLRGASSKRRFVYSIMTHLLVHPLNPTYKTSIPIAIEELRLEYIVSSNLFIVDKKA